MGSFGSKIRFKELPVGAEDIKAVTDVLKAKSLGMGTTVNVLEEEFADYFIKSIRVKGIHGS